MYCQMMYVTPKKGCTTLSASMWTVHPNPDYDPEDENSQKTVMVPEPVAFSMDNVTLKLYSIE